MILKHLLAVSLQNLGDEIVSFKKNTILKVQRQSAIPPLVLVFAYAVSDARRMLMQLYVHRAVSGCLWQFPFIFLHIARVLYASFMYFISTKNTVLKTKTVFFMFSKKKC